MRVYGYLRATCQGSGAPAEPIERQRDAVVRYAEVNGLQVAEVMVEAPRPASLPLERRELGSRLLRLLAPGDAVITPGLDSMFPSARHALATLGALREERIALHMIELGCDICGEAMARLVVGLLGSLSRSERGVEVEDSRAMKRHLASQGPYRGEVVPFGFDAVKGHLVPKPDEYDLLRRMIGMRNEGFGFRLIAREVGLAESRVRAIFARTDSLFGPPCGLGQALRQEGYASSRGQLRSYSLNQAGRAWPHRNAREN